MSKALNIQIGKSLAKIRKGKGYAQSELASGMGLTRTSICNIETGRQALGIESLLKACAILKCSPNDILPKAPNAKVKSVTKVKKIAYDKLLKVDFKWNT